MKIAVCTNHVPDTATKVIVGSDSKTIDPNNVTYVVNPYDEYAIEEALKIKEQVGDDSSVVAISLGGDTNKETIRKALAMGVDSGVLLKDDSQRDSLSVAKALADEIKTQEAKLIFFGKQSVDYDDGVVGQMTAEILGYNCVTVAVDFKLEGEKISVEREIEGGTEIVETSLPCVVTAQKGLNQPRYASLKGIMQAKRKTIEEKDAANYSNSTEVVQMKKPASKAPGKIVGEGADAVPELIRLLKEEAKVI